MSNQSFTASILVDQSPKQLFDAINNVRGWWSEEVQGTTDKLNEVFYYHFKNVHRCTLKIVELVPNKKVVWLVLDNYFDFIKNQTEWVNSKVIFEISEKDGKTELHFTHEGLTPMYECYKICNDAWTGYITKSLPALTATGKGNPNPKE